MKKYFICLTLFLFNASFNKGNAQSVNEQLIQLMKDDSLDMFTVSLYPQQVRENIFRIASHPEGVAKLNDAKNNSNEKFKQLLASYPKNEQEKIWNLTRYNDLMEQLAETKGKKKKMNKVLEQYPQEIHEDAFELAVNQQDLIVSINRINKEFDTSFQEIVASYPKEDQGAFHDMLGAPEAFSLLNKNMHLTVHLGDIYKADPVLLRQHFDSLNMAAAEQNAKDKEAWEKEIAQNPEAEKELKQSAEEFAKDEGYNENETRTTDPKVVEHYVYVPYPYWCGYPSWHAYDYWYPYPYWYHFGFYYNNGMVVWLGAPSWYFIHWHFNHHPHFYHYPHITNLYMNHYYYGPRRSLSRNSSEVQGWMKRNETSLPRDFKISKEQRIDRIREFGKSEMDRDKFNQVNPGKNVNRDEFIKQHAEEYPHLKDQPVEPVSPRDKPADIKPIDKPRTVPSGEKDDIRNNQPAKGNVPRNDNPRPKKGDQVRPVITPRNIPPKSVHPVNKGNTKKGRQ